MIADEIFQSYSVLKKCERFVNCITTVLNQCPIFHLAFQIIRIHQDGVDNMKSPQSTKRAKIDTMRMKDIIAQLTDIIYFLCNAKKSNISTILNQFTNITDEELESLNILFPQDTDDQSIPPVLAKTPYRCKTSQLQQFLFYVYKISELTSKCITLRFCMYKSNDPFGICPMPDRTEQKYHLISTG